MGNYSCHALLNSTLCVHELVEWPASCHGCFTTGGKSPRKLIKWTLGWVGSRPDMVAGEERISETLPGTLKKMCIKQPY